MEFKKKKRIFKSSTPHDLPFTGKKEQVEAGTYSRLDLDTRQLESKHTLHREEGGKTKSKN